MVQKLMKPPYKWPAANRFITRSVAGSSPAATMPSAVAAIWVW